MQRLKPIGLSKMSLRSGSRFINSYSYLATIITNSLVNTMMPSLALLGSCHLNIRLNNGQSKKIGSGELCPFVQKCYQRFCQQDQCLEKLLKLQLKKLGFLKDYH